MTSFLLDWLAGRSMITSIAVAVGLFFLAIVARNWSLREPRPPRIVRHGPFVVAYVTGGTTLVVETGPLHRRQRPVHLTGIDVPAKVQTHARAALECLVNTASGSPHRGVYVDIVDGNRLGSAPLDGAVYDTDGNCLQIILLRAGLARTIGRAPPATWTAAQEDACHNRRGFWP